MKFLTKLLAYFELSLFFLAVKETSSLSYTIYIYQLLFRLITAKKWHYQNSVNNSHQLQWTAANYKYITHSISLMLLRLCKYLYFA